MKKLAVCFVLVLSLCAMAAMAAEMTGTISDAKCGAAHAKKANVACVEKCIKGGGAPVFVTSDFKVLKIDQGKTKVAESFYGHPVKVTGSVDGDTLKLDTIAMNH